MRIRLINIDAPEKKQDYGPVVNGHDEITGCRKNGYRHIFSGEIVYGRILGQVYAPDGMNVNQFMVRAGAAWVYEQ
ncbi:Hypothetical protein FORC64_p233 (plasmid) [Escherichia coli]|uniref:thermonuclease family protein n=1 Tax=Escherichia coli TaxID=562 RepID=UPI000E106E6A|nr:thermonuclease family protein [Escherichia coli]AXI38062.1 Hypothetical protein FORC64_p233 [Escherichia coli]